MACTTPPPLDCSEDIKDYALCDNNNIEWKNIVGEKTLEDGGYFGDLMILGRLHIEEAKDKGELTEQDAGSVYATLIQTSIQQSITFELTEELREREICLTNEQRVEIELESKRKDCKAKAECALIDAQTAKSKQDKINETNESASKISLNAAQENKLACDCCNASKLADADVTLKAAQEALYLRQAEGFDDNALQKLYDSQLQAWAMVFSDTDAEVVTPSLSNEQVCATYDKLRSSLDIVSGGNCTTL